jgi:hypothetical protein
MGFAIPGVAIGLFLAFVFNTIPAKQLADFAAVSPTFALAAEAVLVSLAVRACAARWGRCAEGLARGRGCGGCRLACSSPWWPTSCPSRAPYRARCVTRSVRSAAPPACLHTNCSLRVPLRSLPLLRADVYHHVVTDVTVRVVKLQNLGLSVWETCLAVLMVVVGFITFYLIPYSFTFRKFDMFLAILMAILMAMLFGFCILALLLQARGRASA